MNYLRPIYRIVVLGVVMLVSACVMPLSAQSVDTDSGIAPADSLTDAVTAPAVDSLASVLGNDSLQVAGDIRPALSQYNVWEERETVFNPDPTRAVWMSALFPGLGQLYNRRYWKLPIVVGAYLGLGYATSWNNSMLSDYQRAYSDIMDSDPSTKSYMDFFPSTTKESDLDPEWLKRILKSRKDFYRRNRDLCIICMVGVYFLAMVDAYVDASLSHFDISPDLSLDWSPTVVPPVRGNVPAVGLACTINF